MFPVSASDKPRCELCLYIITFLKCFALAWKASKCRLHPSAEISTLFFLFSLWCNVKLDSIKNLMFKPFPFAKTFVSFASGAEKWNLILCWHGRAHVDVRVTSDRIIKTSIHQGITILSCKDSELIQNTKKKKFKYRIIFCKMYLMAADISVQING